MGVKYMENKGTIKLGSKVMVSDFSGEMRKARKRDMFHGKLLRVR